MYKQQNDEQFLSPFEIKYSVAHPVIIIIIIRALVMLS